MQKLQLVSLIMLILFGSACKKKSDNVETTDAISVGDFYDNWTCAINPGKNANFDVAEFRLWVPNPAEVSKLKGILVLADGFNTNALPMANSKEWQDYASANEVAILAVHFKILGTNDDNYAEAGNGSGAALIMALDAIAKRNAVDEVAALPFLMRGFSAGGMFSYYFSSFKPDRVIAFSNIRGADIAKTSSENKDIPALFLIGELDSNTSMRPKDNPMQSVVKANRQMNGLWSYAIEPNAGHFYELANSDKLTRSFFSSALKLRTITGTNKLASIPPANGWLGNNESRAVFSYSTYPNNKNEASWLIDSTFAGAWKEYQRK